MDGGTMLTNKKITCWTLAATVALGTLGAALTASAEGPKARALREREEKRQERQDASERKEDKKDHPEVWAAIRAIRTARNDIEKSQHEKVRYKESALKSIDQALTELEALMARD